MRARLHLISADLLRKRHEDSPAGASRFDELVRRDPREREDLGDGDRQRGLGRRLTEVACRGILGVLGDRGPLAVTPPAQLEDAY